jgi:hypothetical protein
MKFNESLEPLLFVHLFNNGVRVFMAPLSSADAQHVTNSNWDILAIILIQLVMKTSKLRG